MSRGRRDRLLESVLRNLEGIEKKIVGASSSRSSDESERRVCGRVGKRWDLAVDLHPAALQFTFNLQSTV